jgi:large subunit ribosomal protein L22
MARDAHELATGSRAKASYIWISPTKIRQVAALLQGKPVDEARRILAFSPKVASQHIAKVLESAIANAEHNHHIPQDELFVKRVWADGGPTFKRVSPRARRSAYLIRKRTSHINVEVERAVEEFAEEPAAARERTRLRRPRRTRAQEAPEAGAPEEEVTTPEETELEPSAEPAAEDAGAVEAEALSDSEESQPDNETEGG